MAPRVSSILVSHLASQSTSQYADHCMANSGQSQGKEDDVEQGHRAIALTGNRPMARESIWRNAIRRRFSRRPAEKWEDEVPWKIRKVYESPNGYPRMGTMISRDQSYLIFRQFRYLHNRLLLHRQNELVELEKELDNLDALNNGTSTDPSGPLGQHNDHPRQRQDLFDQIEAKFTAYASLIGILRDFATLPIPSSGDLRSLYFFFCNEKPVRDEEAYYQFKEDLITLKPEADETWIDIWIMALLSSKAVKFLRKLCRDRDPSE
ncbi:hypothetical protein F4778DRAFT_746979 [Xylariomycetidae sp. FL2044]|nr:hypothetical protein F4778DRAFT_746979 [Xylariomycetidae sp. FL2044]